MDNQQSASQAEPQGTEQLQQELEEVKLEAEKNLNGWKRTQADFENYQRRKEAENRELIEFAREVAVAKLLPSLDSIEQAFRHVPQIEDPALKTWEEGVEGLLKQLDKALADLGVKKIQALGQKFDPNFHEAVRETPGEEDQIVVEELQSGFEINGKVIRPSQVVISRKNI